MLKGIAASDGVAVAKAYLLVQPDLSFNKTSVEDTDAEATRLDDALAKSTEELQAIRDKAAQSLGEAEAQVFDAHLMVLSDPEMVGQIKQNIQDNKVNAEAALKEVTDMYIGMFEAMDDNAYMQERAADIRDVAKRILAHLLGVTLPNPSMINEEVIVVAHDLTPSDTAQLDRTYVKAFVTDIGGRTSHSAIMARSLEIPAIVGTKEITDKVKAGDILAVNGIIGDVIIDPTDAEKSEFEAEAKAYADQKAEWDKLKNAETVTADGKHVELAANIGTPKDLEGVHKNGGEAVGLYRTEFLYMDSSDFPTEEDQYQAYKAVLEGMEGKPVVVRTMDIGGDKELPYLTLPHEMNPFLGYRALRISLSELGDGMFRTQMRALLRASVHGNLRIMFPMVATLKEFRAAKAIFEDEKQKLVNEGVEVSNDIQVGIMIEIPAAAVLADKFAKEVDFFSVGTNDLIQYTMAADRMNERVSYLYQPYNPSILRLIKNVIDAAHAEGKWAGMCGEMAGDQTAVPLLLGMGLDEFSMSATSILKTRSLMKRLDTTKMAELADRALEPRRRLGGHRPRRASGRSRLRGGRGRALARRRVDDRAARGPVRRAARPDGIRSGDQCRRARPPRRRVGDRPLCGGATGRLCGSEPAAPAGGTEAGYGAGRAGARLFRDRRPAHLRGRSALRDDRAVGNRLARAFAGGQRSRHGHRRDRHLVPRAGRLGEGAGEGQGRGAPQAAACGPPLAGGCAGRRVPLDRPRRGRPARGADPPAAGAGRPLHLRTAAVRTSGARALGGDAAARRTGTDIRSGPRPAPGRGGPARLQVSRFSTFSAFCWMNSRRGSTTSPMSLVKMSSASARSSTFTCRRVRASGSSVVSHSCSGFISPSPL